MIRHLLIAFLSFVFIILGAIIRVLLSNVIFNRDLNWKKDLKLFFVVSLIAAVVIFIVLIMTE